MTNTMANTFENKNTVVSKDKDGEPSVVLQVTAEYDSEGNRVCTCGSGVPWAQCPGNNGDSSYCG
ncbi:MAG: hypothetical protein Q8Q23_05395 [bacterium]|nr:hypothetical protein [bacterium]